MGCNPRTFLHRYPCFITWWLWYHLRHPPTHAVFLRAIKTPVDNRATRFVASIVLLVGGLTCGGIWTLLSVNISLPMFLLLGIVALSSCYVVAWVMSICGVSTKEHECGTYDLLCLIPFGQLGASWSMCAACLHRSDALGWIEIGRRLLSGILLLILLIVLLTTAFRENTPNLLQFLSLFLETILLTVVAYVEHVQAIVLGSLVGMLVSMRRRMDGRWLAVGVFLTLQVGTVLAVFIMLVTIQPNLDTQFGFVSLSVAIFYLMREGIIYALWRLLVYYSNADLQEFCP